MSIERLNMMKAYFESKRWSILNESAAEYDQGIYEPINQKITWHLQNVDPKMETIVLEIFLFDGLGRRTKNLNDLSHCSPISRDETLYFSKINTQKWKLEYKAFIDQLTKSR